MAEMMAGVGAIGGSTREIRFGTLKQGVEVRIRIWLVYEEHHSRGNVTAKNLSILDESSV
jgi:hypothetical protein